MHLKFIGTCHYKHFKITTHHSKNYTGFLSNKESITKSVFSHTKHLKINNLHINFDEFFTLAYSSVTRGHNYKLIKPLSKNNWLLNVYSSRVVSYWNSLPPDVVNASSFAIFVKKLNLVDLNKFCIVGRA